MERTGIIKRVRQLLHDADGAVFSDNELERLLDEAIKKYSEDTGIFRREFPIVLKNNQAILPPDFLSIVCAFTEDGDNIAVLSSNAAKRLCSDYLNAPGDKIQILYDDLSNDGAYRVYPIPEQSSDDYKEDSYGMFTQMYGVALGLAYGITTAFSFYDNIGSIIYKRKAKLEEVQDYLALVCYVAAMALNEDTDFANSNRQVAAWLQQYRERVSLVSKITKSSAETPRYGEFF